MSTIAVGLGMALMLISLVWGTLFPPERSWGDDKTQRMNELSMQAHQLGGELDSARRHPSMHSKRPADVIEVEYKKTVAELEQLRVEFNEKKDAPNRAASFLRWSGIAFIVAGGLVTFAQRSG